MPEFSDSGYTVLRGVLPHCMCKFFEAYVNFLRNNNLLPHQDAQVSRAYGAYGLIPTEVLLESLAQTFSIAANCELLPTYSYLRLYLAGAELQKHRDRPSCEVSATVCVATKQDKPWPIFLELPNGNCFRADLQPGDCLLYEGMRLPHWREPLAYESQIQIFLHYVREGGLFENLQYDRRARLGLPPVPVDSLTLKNWKDWTDRFVTRDRH